MIFEHLWSNMVILCNNLSCYYNFSLTRNLEKKWKLTYLLLSFSFLYIVLIKLKGYVDLFCTLSWWRWENMLFFFLYIVLMKLREYVDGTNDYIKFMLDYKQNHRRQMIFMFSTVITFLNLVVIAWHKHKRLLQ